MDAKTLIANFDTLASAPGGVARVRELVLQLAVSGRLVQSTATEGGDNEPVRASEPLFTIPRAWNWVTVASLGNTATGTTPPSKEPANYGNHIPFIKPGALDGSGRVDYSGPGLSERGLAKGRLVPAKSVLMVGIGGSLGKVGVVDRPVSCNQQIHALTPNSDSADFLGLVMRAPYFLALAWNNAGKGTLPIINKSKWGALCVPLPPLAEQRRIVAKVDELMALCDELEQKQNERRTIRVAARTSCLDALTSAQTPDDLARAWTRVKAHWPDLTSHPDDIPPLRDMVRQLAVRGALVPGTSEVEEAEALAAKLRDDVASAGGRKRKVPPVDLSEMPFSLPKGWIAVRLGEVAQLINGDRGKNYPSKAHRVECGIPFINAGHMQDGTVEMAEMDYITEERFELLRSGKVEPRDVLYCLRGSLGKAAVVDECAAPGAIASSLLIIRAHGLNPHFLYCLLTSPLGTNLIKKYDNGTAQPNLSASNVAKYLFPLPSLAEQDQIIARLDELMSLCDQLEESARHREELANQFATAAVSI